MIKVVFFGTPQIAVNSFEFLCKSDKFDLAAVVTQQDKPSGRGHKIASPPIKVIAEKYGVRIFQPKSIRKEQDIINELKSLKPDFFVTFAFGQILSQEVLDIPKYATVNLHASLLPAYRGANPIQRCIYNGDTVTGVTTMLTVLDLDAGDICYTEKINITRDMTDVDLANLISDISPALIEKTLTDIVNGELIPKKQDESKVTFADKFVKTDGLIDFAGSAESIVNQVRSMFSWPNAYTYYKGKLLKVMRASCFEKVDTNLSIGAVVSISKAGIEIQTGDGTVLLKEVKPEGKGLMPACAWSNGSGIKVGDILGE